jgi:hypothetical protein
VDLVRRLRTGVPMSATPSSSPSVSGLNASSWEDWATGRESAAIMGARMSVVLTMAPRPPCAFIDEDEVERALGISELFKDDLGPPRPLPFARFPLDFDVVRGFSPPAEGSAMDRDAAEIC